jgi:glycosyltransferase involved in cell wall biosynthesis
LTARSSILLVVQLSPPSSLVAARRTAGLAKYLPRLGHEVTVLTSRVSGSGAVEGAASTVRTRDLAATSLNWRRAGPARGPSVAPTGAVRGVESWVVPDVALGTWLPFALPQALRLVRRRRFDCVITSGPPASAHFVGLGLKRLGARWIADFRDGWTFDPPRPPWPLEIQGRLDGSLERLVAQRADAVTGVTEPIASDLRGRLGARAHLLTNGFDPEEQRDPHLADGLLSPDRHSLVHTGRAGVSGRTPAPLFEALRKLRRRHPTVASRLEVVFAGALSTEEVLLLKDPELNGMVRAVGPLDRPQALSLQQAADSLLVIASGTSERSVATGKLYEYLTAERPILVLGDRSEAARIVATTGTGLAARGDDPEAIASALHALVDSAETRRQPDRIAAYSWEAVAERASAIVESVCGRP